MSDNHLILTAFFFNPQGDNRVSWRYPTGPGQEIFTLDYYKRLALAAEEACIDAMFLADHVAIWDSYPSNIPNYANARLEPITLLSALSAVTKYIGLISTVSASYTEPYNLARSFASLDHLSNGRAGWNVVTSGMDEEAMNYGREASIEHRTRYQRASEYLTVAKELWDSWEDGAVLMDKASGLFADKDRVHRLNFSGDFFKVRGPLNVPRPVQGYPIIVQAGGSEDGRNLAAKHADLNFALLRTITEGQAYRKDFDARLQQFGRPASALKILPGILPIVASSPDEAAEKEALLEKLVPEQVGVDLVSSWVGVDLSASPIDGPIPLLPDEANFNGQRTNLIKVKQYQKEGLTIREVARIVANVGTAPIFAGTPKQIADQLEEWFTAKAADGFNLMFPTIPEDWMQFMQKVVPELRRRNLVPSQYAPGTLRERLHLPKPINQFTKILQPHG